MAKVAVVGVGAIGAVAAAALHTAGQDLVLCTRRPMGALTVTTPGGAIQVTASNLTDPSQAGPVDWVVVATKTYHAAGAGAWLHGLSGSSTRVAVIQNGVEHRQRFAAFVEQERLLPVIIDCPAERQADGSILQRARAKMSVEAGEAGESFAALFAGSQAEVTLTDDFATVAWRKLAINSVGALSAITLKPAGMLREPAVEPVALEMIEECLAVGRAEGATFGPGMAEEILRGQQAGSPDGINSMHADRLAGRPMEIDARNGAIVRFGEKHGIPTPTNRMAAMLLQVAESER